MIKVSDLRRVGSGLPAVYTGGGYRMNWAADGNVSGTDSAGDWRHVGQADSASEAKRVFCDWVNKGGGRNDE